MPLVYGHGFPSWLARRVRAWADRARHAAASASAIRNAWADEQRIAAGPDEFARLMAGARAVVTNFFHGCVFALLNGKPWATAPSDYRAIKIPDLAATLGAEHRIVDERTGELELRELLETPVQPEVISTHRRAPRELEAYLDAALS